MIICYVHMHIIQTKDNALWKFSHDNTKPFTKLYNSTYLYNIQFNCYWYDAICNSFWAAVVSVSCIQLWQFLWAISAAGWTGCSCDICCLDGITWFTGFWKFHECQVTATPHRVEMCSNLLYNYSVPIVNYFFLLT